MERFLERLSLSPYKNSLILKGGALISSMVGLENRTTLDVDTTVKGLQLTPEDAQKIVSEIISVPVEDSIAFEIKRVATIMDELDYPGVRIMLDTVLDKMHTPLKLDFSTGDTITPSEVTYHYKLMFEDRSIPILAYNLETVLAEKMETLLVRGTTTTRMRDFYDILILEPFETNDETLRKAFKSTVVKRGSAEIVAEGTRTLGEIEFDAKIKSQWEAYSRKNEFATGTHWNDVMQAVKKLHTRVAFSVVPGELV
jgi:hypothetical protein